jgi:hypothetical protein
MKRLANPERENNFARHRRGAGIPLQVVRVSLVGLSGVVLRRRLPIACTGVCLTGDVPYKSMHHPMRPRPSFTTVRRLDRWLRRTAAVLAVGAQLALVMSGLGEGRAGLGAGPHVEAAGTSAHYAHDEANCAACFARSLHGAAARTPAPALPSGARTTVRDNRPATTQSSELILSNCSRAPPPVI